VKEKKVKNRIEIKIQSSDD
jgi:hypothetical protein